MRRTSDPVRSPSPRRARRALAGGVIALGLAAAIPTAASAAPAQWSEFDPAGLPQPVEVHPADGQQKMIMVAIPGGGWSAGTNSLLELYRYMDWWTRLAQSKGISVHVITHRQGGFSGAVPLEIGDLGDALGRIRQQNPDTPICVYGLSSGGHLAAMLQILRPDITQCVVSDGGPLDMEAFFQDSQELRGVTLGDFFQGQVAQTQVRDWFNTPEHPDNVDRLSPSTQTNRMGDLFAIEAGRNPDGSAADRSVGDRQGELIRQRIPARTTVRYVHAARDGQDSLPTAHNLYSSFLDGSPGGAEATEARKIYTEAADWMLAQAAKWTARRNGTPGAPATPPANASDLSSVVRNQKVAVALRGTSVRPDAKGRISLRVRCTGATTSCRGTVRATVSGVPSKAVSYRITPSRSSLATVRVPLSARQLELLSRHTSVLAKVRMTAASPQRRSSTKTANLRIRRTAALARERAAALRAERR
jgi:acetyl esterase/lipase